MANLPHETWVAFRCPSPRRNFLGRRRVPAAHRGSPRSEAVACDGPSGAEAIERRVLAVWHAHYELNRFTVRAVLHWRQSERGWAVERWAVWAGHRRVLRHP